jgi:hypothetical protein
MPDMLNPIHYVVFLLCLGVAGYLFTWAAKDARLRGNPPILVVLAAALYFPLGLVLWLLFRPPVQSPSGEPPKFRIDDYPLQ